MCLSKKAPSRCQSVKNAMNDIWDCIMTHAPIVGLEFKATKKNYGFSLRGFERKASHHMVANFVFRTLCLRNQGLVMQTKTIYDAECEGCGIELEISIEGYIGLFQGVWCASCGFEGENQLCEECYHEDEEDQNTVSKDASLLAMRAIADALREIKESE